MLIKTLALLARRHSLRELPLSGTSLVNDVRLGKGGGELRVKCQCTCSLMSLLLWATEKKKG